MNKDTLDVLLYTAKQNFLSSRKELSQFPANVSTILSTLPNFTVGEASTVVQSLHSDILHWFSKSDLRIVKNSHNIGHNVLVFTVNNSETRERNFARHVINEGNQTHFKFHGSSIYNWFPIIMHGLKVMSHTAYMTSGAAYGSGIYLSDAMGTSLGYCGVELNDFRCIGIFEVAGKPDKYKKTTHTFVVPDESMVMLRKLFFLPPNFQNLGPLQTYLETTVTKVPKSGNKIKKKRIFGELLTLEQSNLPGLSIETCDENMYQWQVSLGTAFFDEKSQLVKDMQFHKISKITISVLFPNDYPFDPPFIYIVSPTFHFRTGHITSDGSFCFELLTRQGWSSIITMEHVLLSVKLLMEEGDARILNPRGSYSLVDAKKSFERVSKTHGWV